MVDFIRRIENGLLNGLPGNLEPGAFDLFKHPCRPSSAAATVTPSTNRIAAVIEFRGDIGTPHTTGVSVFDSRISSPGVKRPGVGFDRSGDTDVARFPKGGRGASEGRSNGDTDVAAVSLRQLLDELYLRRAADKCDSTWSGYRTLVDRWERFHDGPGPDCRKLDAHQLRRFFEGVDEWRSPRSWQKNANWLSALLKSGCPQTMSNRNGVPPGEPVRLDFDRLPVFELPRDRWFRDRLNRLPPTTERGGHRRRRLPLISVDEFGRVLDACDGVEFLTPEFWRCLLSWIWFAGTRFTDIWSYRWDSGVSHVSIVQRLHSFTETKTGGTSDVPLPSWLLSQLETLRTLQGGDRAGLPVFSSSRQERDDRGGYVCPRGDWTNRGRRFSPAWSGIFERADVPLRKPHELRAACVSYWFKHAPNYRFAATGHAPPSGDVQLRNYVILDDQFRDVAESFPFPDAFKGA